MGSGIASENGFVDSVGMASEGVSEAAVGGRSLPIWLGMEIVDAES